MRLHDSREQQSRQVSVEKKKKKKRTENRNVKICIYTTLNIPESKNEKRERKKLRFSQRKIISKTRRIKEERVQRREKRRKRKNKVVRDERNVI